MKKLNLFISLVILMCMANLRVMAYDIAVTHIDGVTLYYNYINDGKELEVTYKSGYVTSSHPRTSGYEEIEKVTIPSKMTLSGKEYKVTGIGAHAFDCFSGRGGLTECNFKLSYVHLPTTIKYIGEEAFDGCKSLKSIHIPSGVTSIGERAFHDSGLEHITIPNAITTIENGCFSYCTSLKSISFPDKIRTIKKEAFEDTSISELNVPSSLQTIEDYAFHDCEYLKHITFSGSLTTLTEKAFAMGDYKKSSLTTIEYLTDDIAQKGPLFDISTLDIDTVIVSERAYPHLLENSEWEKCDRIFARGADKRLYVGIQNENNSMVGVNGIYDKKLILVPYDEETVLQRTTTSPNEMYVMLNGESSLLTPDNPNMIVKPSSFRALRYNIVYVIDRSMSGDNNYHITMTSSGTLLSQIGRDNLEKVKRLKIIGDINGTDILAIKKMSGLEELDLSEANIVNGGVAYLNNYTTSANEIGVYFFKDLSNLLVLHFPKTGTRIMSYAFDGCTKLQEVNILASFTGIGEHAFSGSGIKKVIFEASEKPIGINNQAFENTAISTLEFYRNSPGLYGTDKNSLRKLIIDGEVTSIGNYAFTQCNSLESVVIGPKVANIGRENFANSVSLEKVIFKDSDEAIFLGNYFDWSKSYNFFGNSPIKELYLGRNLGYSFPNFHYGTFMNLTSLIDLTIGEKVTEIIQDQFRGDTSLKKVTIPNSVTSIARSAFQDCSSLIELSMSDQLEGIDQEAFANCISLKNIEVPQSVSSIGYKAFFNCKSMTSISIGNNVSYIDGSTFSGCSSLKEVSLGKNIQSIEDNAFDGCKNIRAFYSWNPTPPAVNSASLNGINRNVCTLYVPIGSGDIYWLHPEWELFFQIKEVAPTGIECILKKDHTNSKHSYYSIDGKQLNSFDKGLNIIKMSDGTTKKVFIK